jgi:large conductance mechanosensitive channel
MLKGFRAFALRGDVIELSIAVVIGVALETLIGSVAQAVILPFVGIFLGGGVEAGQIVVQGQVFDVTMLLSAILVFLITVAVIYFFFVVPINRLRATFADEPAGDSEPSEDVVLLREIRDLLTAQQR